MAPFDASTHAGCNPLANRSAQKLHFSTTPIGPGGKFAVHFLVIQAQARILEIETAAAVGTCGHAETAPDTAVKIHQHDAIAFAFESGLGRAHPHAGRILAMVAQNQVGAVLGFFIYEWVWIIRKGIMVMGFPNPFDFMVCILKIRDVVGLMTGFDHGFQVMGTVEPAGIDDHAPLLGR